MSEIYVSNFGELIKKYRINRGINQKTIAERINVSKSTYSLYESGKRFPTAEKAVQISHILGIPLDDLFAIPVSIEVNPDDSPLKFLEIKEEKLIDSFRELNQFGKEKATQYINDLTKIPEYRKDPDQDSDQE